MKKRTSKDGTSKLYAKTAKGRDPFAKPKTGIKSASAKIIAMKRKRDSVNMRDDLMMKNVKTNNMKKLRAEMMKKMRKEMMSSNKKKKK